jgi:short-subunit dehydrogenase
MTALITGASSGIGLELARVFAANKHDVVLVARSEGKLRELARECEASGVRAHVVAADLAKPDAARAIVDAVARLGVEIDVLVNNAGFGVYGRFVETPLVSELESIQVNVVALTELTKRFLPAMVARRRGRILNVASTAGFLPGPLMAVYYATKAYVVSFSEATANELEGTGVTVTVLCPGPTDSGFQAAAKLEKSRLVSLLRKATSRSVAEAGYDAVMAGKVVCIPGVSNKVSAILAPRLFPRAIIRKVVRAIQEPGGATTAKGAS